MLPRAGVHSDRALASRLGESEALRASASLPCLAPFFGHLLRTPLAESRLGLGNLSINGEFSSRRTNQGLFSRRHSLGKPEQPTSLELLAFPEASGSCSSARRPRSRAARPAGSPPPDLNCQEENGKTSKPLTFFFLSLFKANVTVDVASELKWCNFSHNFFF